MDEPDIPFLDALGRDFHRVALRQTRTAGRRRAWRRWSWRVAPAVLLVCAGTATAGVLLLHRSPTQLVAGGLQCMDGTSNAARFGIADVEPRGLTPTQACGHALGVPASRLVACVDDRYGTVVYEASGAVDQCEELKMSALPAGYGTATRRIARLQAALNAIYDAHVCLTPAQLAADSQRVLRQQGFNGWRTRVDAAPSGSSTGPCGQFTLGSSGVSNAAGTLARGNLVIIQTGSSRPIAALLNRLEPKLRAQSSHTCRNESEAKTLAHNAFSARGLVTRFAITREPAGVAYSGQRLYQRGCAVIISPTTAPNGRTVLVWIIDRHAPALPHGVGIPTVAMYHEH